MKVDYEAHVNKERVENVSTENFNEVSKCDVIINKKRTYADVVSNKKE